ncbi:penicillin acylase family protein [Microbacterium sp. W1N]|uniref:penicillin acylase family protein n=1 Tax=Microbacterium festucae TaxID=2977531 RepID=UPI0021BEA597|nr:penicillin acylase family protein [Microbacterium festucae]MCT9819428.1 penicillin acylase family protein [Microbacterium festucae]
MPHPSSLAPLTPDTEADDPAARPRRSLRRKIAIALFGLVAGVTVIALIAAGFALYTVQRSFPQLSGTISAPGLTDEVTVHRDTLGVPTIVADNTHDLFYAQGYVHAQDRFWEMDFRRHVTSGRLSELFGASQLGTDRFLRTLGWHEIAQREVDALDDATRDHYDAYAEGVNAYLADHDGAAASLEYAVLGLQNADYEIEPWTPTDSVAWLKAMAWDLRTNIEDETERALLAATATPAQIAELYPDYPYARNPVIVPQLSTPADITAATASASMPQIAWDEVDGVVEAAAALLGGVGEGVGSNSWVVSGRFTESGMPLLSNDPHLGASLPSVWYQVGLRCRVVSATCGFDVAGFSFSGMPGVIIGHNADIAWGFTNLTTDVTDLYLEKVQGDQYWRDGALVPLDIRTETIEVAGDDPVQLEIRSTVHGPIVSGLTGEFTAIADDPFTATDAVTPVPAAGAAVPGSADAVPPGENAVALRWTALEPGTTARAIFALDTATDFDGFREAAALFDVPAQNLIYADREGNIGYQTPGRLPVRGAGDGSMPQPGWDSAYDWTGMIPFDDLPVALNPDSGFIVTANNAIVGADYPHPLTRDWDYGWRAARITDLLQRATASGGVTADTMSAIQADQEFWMGKRLVAAFADVSVADADAQRALDLLDAWDAQNTPDSAAAAYANVLWDELAQNLFSRRADPAPVTGQARLFLVVDGILDDAQSPWWTNEQIDVQTRAEMLETSATDAYHRLAALQGDDPAGWRWGTLHAITLTSGTFGTSGIAPIEWLFNRGPYPVGGGASVVDATGWSVGSGSFATTTVPSMRMTVDLADLDASRWNHLTGQSGHAFHPNYIDQVDDWQHQRQTPWLFSLDRLADTAADTLVLAPAE